MRRWFLSAAVVTPALLLGAVACVDLFHGTDVPTICDADASAPGCGDAGPVATDLCSPDAGIAQDRAVHACSWLAACESPIGHNATGMCMVDAILAFDCAANPNRKPKLAAKAYWSCLDKAKSCADVLGCTVPSSLHGKCTTAGFLGCYTGDPRARVQCLVTGATLTAENCVARGQTCDSIGGADSGTQSNALCLGSKGRSCTASGCNGSMVAACDDAGLDHGTDCSLFGEGSCITTGAQPACKPESSNPWPATTDIKCGGGVAQGSASGFLETVDCTAISGPGTCTAVANPPPGTPVVAACQGTSGCSVDTCSTDGGALVACVAGRSVPVNCVGLGLNPCDDTVPTLEGTHAACRKP